MQQEDDPNAINFKGSQKAKGKAELEMRVNYAIKSESQAVKLRNSLHDGALNSNR